jgi:hypothetical protein
MTKSLRVVPAVFLFVIAAGPAFAQATMPAECQPMLAAGEKQFTVPSHAMMTTTGMGPATMNSEVVNIDGVMYLKVMEHWMKSPMSSEQVAKQAREKMAAGKTSCKQLPDESIDGVSANVYSSHTDMDKGSTDSRVWVAKSTGLPLKSEVEMTMSGGKKSHVSVKYDYEHVKAPEGVK